MQIPLVTKAVARDYYSKAWHLGRGVKPLLDDVTMQFAVDFCNVVLKQSSGLCYQYAKAQLLAEIRELKKQKAVDAEAAPVQPEQKSSIILTD
jgi:hypothetical protein